MRTAVLAVAVLLAALVPTAPACAQLNLQLGAGAEANPVPSSKDFDAICTALALDDTQRQIAGTAFDDAQDRMFEAKRLADAVRSRTGTDPSDDQAMAEREQSRKALAQAILNGIDDLFRAVMPLVGADQRPVLERERLAAKRRAIRAMLGGGSGAAQFDMERAFEKASVDPARAAAASAQLDGYRQRIGSLLQKMLEDAIAEPRRSARARPAPAAADSPENSAFIASIERLNESQASQRETVAQLASAHRDALGLVAGSLSPAELAKVREQMLRRVWPRTGMDPLSPARAIEQLLRRQLEPATRAAVEAARDSWQPRWWSVTLRMTAAEDATRGSIPLLGPAPQPDDAAAKARAQLRELRDERTAIDRDAWKSLAAADPGNREFHERMASPKERVQPFGAPPELPAAPGSGGNAEGVAVDLSEAMGNATVGVSMVMVQSNVAGDGGGNAGIADAEPIVFTTDSDDVAGGNVLMMAGEGMPMVFGDRFGDGMGSNMDFSAISFGDPKEEGKTTVGLPARIGQPRLATMARVLGLDPAHPALVAMLADYESKAEALRTGFEGTGRARDGMELATLEDAASAPARVDEYAQRLAELEDALVRDVAALAGADAAFADAVRDERAAERARSTRHALGLMNDVSPKGVCGVDLGACIADSGLASTDRTAAQQAWAAWAPASRAAAERWLAVERTAAPEMAAAEAAMRRSAEDIELPAGGGNESRSVSIAMSGEEFKRRETLMEQLSDALVAVTETSVRGRNAVRQALADPARAQFESAWLRAAAPKVYADARDAAAKLDAAAALATLSAPQRQQLDALRADHAARHRDACDRIAIAVVAGTPGGADALGTARPKDTNIQVSDGRFERAELNARTIRRLRSILSAEQQAAVPGLSPATTPPAPARASP